jgi:small acid-soluble spore protein H (minor)
MEANRAQEISSSQNMVNVSHKGKPVYIEHVDQSSGVATVHPLDAPTNKQSVPVAELDE